MTRAKTIIQQTMILLVCWIPYLSYTQIPYLENFTGQNGKGAVGTGSATAPTIDVPAGSWTIDVSAATLSATSDWFQVKDEVMEAQDTDGEVIWTSPDIIIDNASTAAVLLSVDLAEFGNHESGDYANVSYILDGGAEVPFANNGNNSDDFTAVTAEQNLVFSNNTSLQIVVRMRNNAGAELLKFDNVSVKELAACAEPTDQPTSLVLTAKATSISGSFSVAASDPDNYIVIMSTAASLSNNPVDAINYNIGDAIGGGIVVTKTSLSSFDAEELTQSTLYYFFVFSLNSICSGGPDYNVTSPLTVNTTTLTTL